MRIEQKKAGHGHVFTFEDDHVNYAYKDRTGSGDVDIDYAALPDRTSTHLERNEWLRNVGYLWLVIGALQMGSALYAGASLSGRAFWLFMGLICLAWYRFRQVNFSVLQSEVGNVFIIQGEEHDRIVSELERRRKDRLLSLYGEIDLENDPSLEIEKFRWLVKRKVLSSQDAELKIAEIQKGACGMRGRAATF